MKTRRKPGRLQFQLKLLGYGNNYYIERAMALEKALARKPRWLQIELIGVGEIPADMALLIRTILMARKSGTQIVTHARSSLVNGSVLVWLLGDQRIIRPDAWLFFRPADLSASDESEVWKDKRPFGPPAGVADPEEHAQAQVLELINEFLPVKEMAGQLIGVPVLRQFGLVENEQLDQFLATALGKNPLAPQERQPSLPAKTKVPQK